jgi:hypothetical protein
MSTRAAPKQEALPSGQDEVLGDSADALLRRMQHHVDANGSSQRSLHSHSGSMRFFKWSVWCYSAGDGEVDALFDALDERGTGSVTQQDLRAGLEKVQLLSKVSYLVPCSCEAPLRPSTTHSAIHWL